MNTVPVTIHGKDPELPEEYRGRQPSEMEHRFTSTGVKFWHHPAAMESYRAGTGRSVISTHISPEGRCNLTCSYCSVSERVLHSRIDLGRIIRYVLDLKSRGLKAVILTGGGEPTLYPQFNELAYFILDQGLELALITNGTMFRKVGPPILKRLTWLRVSMNNFDGWADKIEIPVDRVGRETVVGMSLCHSGDNKDKDFVWKVAEKAQASGAKYVRILPDCMLPQAHLVAEHQELDRIFGQFPGAQFFHQFKIHGAPCQSKCHQSFFRPYLSEQVDPETGRSGLVFPCDSVVLNDQAMEFATKFSLCPPESILAYIDGLLPQKFDATKDCTGCVFTRNVDMLDKFVRDGESPMTAGGEVKHVNFV